MEPHLLFLTSEYFAPLTRAALERLNPDCKTTVVAYENFSQLPHLYRSYQDNCDAVFVSGVSALRILQIHCGNIPKPLIAFQVDSDGLHRDILRFALENQSLDFSRVAMDFMIPFDYGYSVSDFLKLENLQQVFSKNQNWMHTEEVRCIGAEQLIFQRIISLWNQGDIDCVICMYSSNMPKLQALGIPCRCPFLSDSHLLHLIRETLVKLELTRLHDNHPAIIQIFPRDCSLMTPCQSSFLTDTVQQYLQENLIDCVVRSNDACCTVITSLQVARFLTEDFQTCRLSALLSDKLGFPLIAAYGIGTTISHAMNNVQLASKEAKLMEQPFSMDSNGNLIGPMDQRTITVISQAARTKLSDIAVQSSLSVMTVQKLVTILHSRGSDKITIQELAQNLNTTVRNANRIMKNLLKGGFALPVYTQTSHSRGRPVQVYSLTLQISD